MLQGASCGLPVSTTLLTQYKLLKLNAYIYMPIFSLIKIIFFCTKNYTDIAGYKDNDHLKLGWSAGLFGISRPAGSVDMARGPASIWLIFYLHALFNNYF